MRRFLGIRAVLLFFVLEFTSCFALNGQFLMRYDTNSLFYEQNARCEKIGSGLHLTDLTCVTMARLPVFGYVKRTTDGDKVSSCWRCGPDVIGVPDNFDEKEVWASIMPAQYLTMDNVVGNVIIGERINASMPSGASVQTDTERGEVLYQSGADNCVTANTITNFSGITVTLWFRLPTTPDQNQIKLFYITSSVYGKGFQLRCHLFLSPANIVCIANLGSLKWSVTVDKTGMSMLGQWFHLGVTWGPGEGMVVYEDGVKSGECPKGLESPAAPDKIPKMIVGCSGSGYQNFQGLIDDVVIWDDVLASKFMNTYFRPKVILGYLAG